VYGNGIPIGLSWEWEQKHRIGNGNKGGEWETTSIGTELPALPWEFIPTGFMLQ